MAERLDLAAVEAARPRIAGLALRTPLVPLQAPEAPAEIYLKLENLQPIGSFKLRGAGNALALAAEEDLRGGVLTASAGNMAQGVAWVARERALPCSVVVPDHAPAAKLDRLEALGAEIIKVPFDRWWQILLDHRYEELEDPVGGPGQKDPVGGPGQKDPVGGPGRKHHFVHPVCDPAVMAGNGTIGLEILEDLPDVAAVVVPFGGGGLSSGIATVLRAKAPDVRVFAAEVETAAPLFHSLAAGEPREVSYEPSFVDGIGGKGILPEMWPLVSRLLDASIVVSLAEVAAAIRLLAEANHVVAEGAGAAAVAAALSGRAGRGRTAPGKVVAVVSGGNIDAAKLATILRGEVP